MPENTEDNSIIENHKLIYQEVSKARVRQSDDIDSINQKFNWILAVNILLIGNILQIKPINSLSVFLAFILTILSSTLCLLSLFTRDYKTGPKITSLYDKSKNKQDIFLKAVNEKIISDINENRNIIKNICFLLQVSIAMIIIAILLLFINYYNSIL